MNQRETILRALRSEEESFSKTLDRGLARFNGYGCAPGGRCIRDEAFSLYDTYGFPFDLTALMASEKDWVWMRCVQCLDADTA